MSSAVLVREYACRFLGVAIRLRKCLTFELVLSYEVVALLYVCRVVNCALLFFVSGNSYLLKAGCFDKKACWQFPGSGTSVIQPLVAAVLADNDQDGRQQSFLWQSPVEAVAVDDCRALACIGGDAGQYCAQQLTLMTGVA